ncbi:hypothetical protein Salat_0440400 [Sesamum alatum]|uniref:Uncharacterized protein n=1 Tax=Sesamum alatum TaxID=300844 RepID=A0AAE1Z2F3_9LAMI|nr:hypothetical protein Salat_0440400 [Sesamum alatum]
MRVLFCKIQCPFMCFCKPSATHLYAPGPLKLENHPHVFPSTVSDDVSDESSSSSSSGLKEEDVDGKHEAEVVLKSCLRRLPSRPERDVGKKRVRWRDSLGKELVEIKEFESSETGDTDNEEESSRCLCVIL